MEQHRKGRGLTIDCVGSLGLVDVSFDSLERVRNFDQSEPAVVVGGRTPAVMADSSVV